MGTGPAAQESAAEAYARRCYEERLEVIAITDHNFASRDFIPVLREALGKVAGDYGAPVITLLPGFELQADVGLGVHVLAIFDPASDLNALDHLLTECGIPMPRFSGGTAASSTCRLPQILERVQQRGTDGALRGIVILPHSQSKSGIFDNGNIAEWLQRHEFTNPDLYCVEVPKPPSEMSEGWQRLFRNGGDCDPQWKRIRPIATIMSSDCKAIAAGQAPNYIGWRFSWLKMSSPSIEALRQAFLDPSSRIRLGSTPPDLPHTRVAAIRVSNVAFLDDIKIAFSPNLNTLIGGAGSGKSTLIEYLRLALHKGEAIYGEAAQRNHEKILETLDSKSIIEVDLFREDELWTLRSLGGRPAEVIVGPAIPNISKFFPVRFISQREIYAIAEDRSARIALLDNLIADDLSELRRSEEDLTRELAALDRELLQIPALASRRADLETERLDLQTRKDNLKRLEEPLGEWRTFLEDEAIVRNLEERSAAVAASLRRGLTENPFARTGANTDEHRTLYQKASEALEQLAQDVERDTKAFEAAIQALGASVKDANWVSRYHEARARYEALRKDLSEQDAAADPERYLALDREVTARSEEIAAVAAQETRALSLLEERPGLLGRLQGVWDQQTELRVAKGKELEAAVPATSAGTPFVEVTVEKYADEAALFQRLARYRLDGRRISEDEWRDFANALAKASHGQPPFNVLRAWITALRTGEVAAGFPWSAGDRQAGVVLEWFQDSQLAELDAVRIPDRVLVALNRADGTRAGELEEGLSVGQKCTAILALLLADDDAPIVIDQPEDDIDNEFTYQQLVPLLRGIKERRQLIIATHDPNIPVNGDAELICALEARAGRGQVRKAQGGAAAVGALDQEVVRRAVEDIMEGSEEAFRRRFEKYGF